MPKQIFKYILPLLLLSCVVIVAHPVYAEEAFECTRNITFTASGAVDNGAVEKGSLSACTSVDVGSLGFQIPSLGDILTFAIRAFFVIAGLAALFYMLIGAFAWVTSGGDKDAVGAARDKIQAAVVGMILIVAVLAIIWTLEQVVFKRRICMGLSCPLTLPGLIETAGQTYPDPYGNPIMETKNASCCVCIKNDGTWGDRITPFRYSCDENGVGKKI